MEKKWKFHTIQSLTSSRLKTDQEIRSDLQFNLLNFLLCFISRYTLLSRIVSFWSLLAGVTPVYTAQFQSFKLFMQCLWYYLQTFRSKNVSLTNKHIVLVLTLAFVVVPISHLIFLRKCKVSQMYLLWSCRPVLSSFKDYLKMQRKTLF